MHLNMALLLLTLFSWRVLAASDITYCSTVNTGASNAANVSVYQSNGLCTDTCNADYAFGILQGKSCWCSDIAPNKATNVATSKCDTGCPGYPDDSCGSASDGVFAYIQMNEHSPSGTATVSSSTSTSTTSSTTTTSSDSSKTTEAPTTTASQSVETVAGEIKTITVPNAKPTSSSAGMSEKESSGSGLSGGAIAGVVIGSIGALAAIIAILFLIFFKKRQARSTSPSPSVSNGLLDGRNSKSSQMSIANRTFSDTHSHTLSAGSSRLPTFTDTRLKTDTVLYAGGRRDSDVSLQDNEDYSRPVLRLTNPD
ncbi:hypothetical protein BDV26DRAFT_218150 [Aspergillus bertholletiae]|uniref:WSC domain-containing protein n=1 Tax=Aspergillus bertholletiae TaxID=1226010 RepID=A0A5N7B523_9EURO|nr:hypothetical protein BDV26DRAFT_218150 [Aspergillus bertholletiae]